MATTTELARRPKQPALSRSEAEGSARLAGEMLGELVGWIRDTHLGISGRWFGLAGSAGWPAARLHDSISKGVYAAVGGTARGAGALAAGAARAGLIGSGSEGITEQPGPGRAISAINGVLGDRLQQQGNGLALEMSIRVRGRGIVPRRAELAEAFPAATSRVAVFLHGLTENETFWHRPPGRRSWHPVSYGRRLADDHGITPIYIRYNSGLRVSENGVELDRLFEQLIEEWPVEVREIVLIGHSMGALVARSATHQACEAGHRWTHLVRHVVSLGAPHGGSWLAQRAHVAAEWLGRLPETRALASVINTRSAGIRDMRFGPLVEAHWDHELDDCLAADARGEIPWLEGARHYFIAATLTRDPDHALSRVCGDLLVCSPSAWAEGKHGEQGRWQLETSRIYGGLTHFDLLGHPAIADQISEWIGAAPTAPGALPPVATIPAG